MELNNKQDLIQLLAESEYQELGADGNWAVKSIFEDIPRDWAISIFKETRENLKEHLAEQGEKEGTMSLNPMEVITVGLRNVQLNNTLEILHYLFEAGRTYQELGQRFEKLNEKRQALQDRLEEEGADGPLAVALALNNKMAALTAHLRELRIDLWWKEKDKWAADLMIQLKSIEALIAKLY